MSRKGSHTAALVGCLLLLGSHLAAQSEQRLVRGVLKDQQTLEPLAAVHVVTTQRGTFSDENGFFSMPVGVSDTIVFSHVNYRSMKIAHPTFGDTLFLFLTSRDVLLREVTVLGLPAEEQFRRQALGIRTSVSQEEVNAQVNVAIAQEMYRAGYVPLMDSRDNHQWQLQEPKGVTLFSSGSNKGLFRALKNLSRPSSLPALGRGRPDLVQSFTRLPRKTDTLSKSRRPAVELTDSATYHPD